MKSRVSSCDVISLPELEFDDCSELDVDLLEIDELPWSFEVSSLPLESANERRKACVPDPNRLAELDGADAVVCRVIDSGPSTSPPVLATSTAKLTTSARSRRSKRLATTGGSGGMDKTASLSSQRPGRTGTGSGGSSARERTVRRIESNERERMRMHLLNDAFQGLREVIPHVRHGRKLSKIETLTLAKNYIKSLTNVICEMRDEKTPFSVGESPNGAGSSDGSTGSGCSSRDGMEMDDDVDIGENDVIHSIDSELIRAVSMSTKRSQNKRARKMDQTVTREMDQNTARKMDQNTTRKKDQNMARKMELDMDQFLKSIESHLSHPCFHADITDE